jgi:hypothetical protein
MIKMSIYAFIFEMMSVRVVLESESPQMKKKKNRIRKIIMYSVIIIHTVCIILIETYNWFYLVKADK